MLQNHGKLNSVSRAKRHPVYMQLRALFMEWIRTGEWKPGQVTPTEVQLAGTFGVSVGTVRKVMDELSELGLVTRQQGRGTFVTDRTMAGGCNLFEPIRNADGSTIRWDSPHLTVSADSITVEETAKFGPSRSVCDVLRLTWLKFSGKRALALQKSVVPVEAGLDVEQARHVGNLRDLFSRAGILVLRSEDRLSIAMPDDDTTKRLNVASDRPLQHLSRRFFDGNGTVVGLCSSWLALEDEHYTCAQALRQDNRLAG